MDNEQSLQQERRPPKTEQDEIELRHRLEGVWDGNRNETDLLNDADRVPKNRRAPIPR